MIPLLPRKVGPAGREAGLSVEVCTRYEGRNDTSVGIEGAECVNDGPGSVVGMILEDRHKDMWVFRMDGEIGKAMGFVL
jgi:hypothetical protein